MRPRACSGYSLRGCGQEAGNRTHQIGIVNTRGSAAEKDGAGSDEEEEVSKPSLVTSSAGTGRIRIQTVGRANARGTGTSAQKDGAGSDEEEEVSGSSLVTSSAGAARTRIQAVGHANARGTATSAQKDEADSEEEENLRPSLVTSSAARIRSNTTQEVVQEETTPAAHLPPGWTLQKVEPDW